MNEQVGKLCILEGILFALVGILLFINPGETFIGITSAIGILIMISAASKIYRGWRTPLKGYYLCLGIIDVLFGLILLFLPFSAMESLLLFYGAWCLVRGIYNLISYIKNKNFNFNFRTFGSFVDIVIGLIIVFCPFTVVIVLPFLPYLLGVYFIFLAISEIYIGWMV